MEKIKTTAVSITTLKITSEDKWLQKWVERHGATVGNSPQFKYLLGDSKPMQKWMQHRLLPANYLSKPLMETLASIIKEGQKEPIKIYKDGRINTGHKRAACLLFLGHDTIQAEIVEDDYKL